MPKSDLSRLTKVVIFATAFLFLGFFLVEDIDACEVYYIHQDHLGSTTVITKDGNKVEDVKYYPYGVQRGNDLNTDITEKGFTGQVKDSQTGLYYYNARYYNPTLAKFTQPDTVADQENRYAYVANNPVNITDPTGNMMDVGEVGGASSEPITRYQKDIPDPCEGNYYSLECVLGTGSPLMGEDYAQNEIDRLIAAGEITVPPPDDPGVAVVIIVLDLLSNGTLGNFVDGLICAAYGPDYCAGALLPYVPASGPKVIEEVIEETAEPPYWEVQWWRAVSSVQTDPTVVKCYICFSDEEFNEVLEGYGHMPSGNNGRYLPGGSIVVRHLQGQPKINIVNLRHEYYHHLSLFRAGIDSFEKFNDLSARDKPALLRLLYRSEAEAYGYGAAMEFLPSELRNTFRFRADFYEQLWILARFPQLPPP